MLQPVPSNQILKRPYVSWNVVDSAAAAAAAAVANKIYPFSGKSPSGHFNLNNNSNINNNNENSSILTSCNNSIRSIATVTSVDSHSITTTSNNTLINIAGSTNNDRNATYATTHHHNHGTSNYQEEHSIIRNQNGQNKTLSPTNHFTKSQTPIYVPPNNIRSHASLYGAWGMLHQSRSLDFSNPMFNVWYPKYNLESTPPSSMYTTSYPSGFTTVTPNNHPLTSTSSVPTASGLQQWIENNHVTANHTPPHHSASSSISTGSPSTMHDTNFHHRHNDNKKKIKNGTTTKGNSYRTMTDSHKSTFY